MFNLQQVNWVKSNLIGNRLKWIESHPKCTFNTQSLLNHNMQKEKCGRQKVSGVGGQLTQPAHFATSIIVDQCLPNYAHDAADGQIQEVNT